MNISFHIFVNVFQIQNDAAKHRSKVTRLLGTCRFTDLLHKNHMTEETYREGTSPWGIVKVNMKQNTFAKSTEL